MTAIVASLVAHCVAGQAGPAAIVIGNGLVLSSTAVVLQVNLIILLVDFTSLDDCVMHSILSNDISLLLILCPSFVGFC